MGFNSGFKGLRLCFGGQYTAAIVMSFNGPTSI